MSLLVSLTLSLTLPVRAQHAGVHASEQGMPFYATHFPAHAYGAYPQNWWIAQDDDGLVYAGNYDGVLVYDGVSWELIRTETNTTARSLAVGPSGNVYVGLQGDVGYLSGDSLAALAFTSLRDELPEEERDFWDVW